MKNLSVTIGIEVSNACPNALDLTVPETFSEVLFPLYLIWADRNLISLDLLYYVV